MSVLAARIEFDLQELSDPSRLNGETWLIRVSFFELFDSKRGRASRCSYNASGNVTMASPLRWRNSPLSHYLEYHDYSGEHSKVP